VIVLANKDVLFCSVYVSRKGPLVSFTERCWWRLAELQRQRSFACNTVRRAILICFGVELIHTTVCPIIALNDRIWSWSVAVAALRQVLAGPMPWHWQNGTWRWDLAVVLWKVLILLLM